jgi:AraC-like DNA-binding protein
MNRKSLLYLWEERTLFIGKLGQSLNLSQGAATLTLSLEGPILIESSDTKVCFESTSVLLKPGCSVNIDTRNQLVANCNLDVMGQDFESLSALSLDRGMGIYSNLSCENSFKTSLLDIYRNAEIPDKTNFEVNHLFKTCRIPNYKVDKRVLAAVDLIKQSIDTNISIENLAEFVNLSVPGLTKLFKKQTGVPIRRYRLWHRLFVTAVEISRGKNLTDAAIDAGFTDLSHCTHTFNAMFGIKPSYFLARPEEIIIMTENKTIN